MKFEFDFDSNSLVISFVSFDDLMNFFVGFITLVGDSNG